MSDHELDSSNFAKYQTSNPLVAWLTGRFLDRIGEHVARLRPERIVDLGCGEGIVAERIAQKGFTGVYRGIEMNPEVVDYASRLCADFDRFTFEQGDILEIDPVPGWGDLAICLELLEHLEAPEQAVQRIADWTSAAVIISVPWEPYFRLGNLLRGKHIASLGNTPEHLQQFGPRSLEALLRKSFPRVEVGTCFPWLIVLANKQP